MSEPHAIPEVLVETGWVADHLEDRSIVIAEVNTDLDADYSTGHVPGAVGWGLHTDLEDQVRRDIPTAEQIESLLGRSGVDNGTTVVLYGDGNNRSATWAFWVLKYYGHEKVKLMNGGRVKWVDEGKPLTTSVPTPSPKKYAASDPDADLRATKDYILAHLGEPDTRLLDTRTLEEYNGELTSAPGMPQPDIYRKGRIPGAVHVPWDDAGAEDGRFKPVEELKAMYEGMGLTPDQEVVPYCRLGMRASYSWFVLKYLLGYEKVRNYDGSWTEWGNAVGTPIETGSGE